VGGESTRPLAAPVDEEEELRRVMPVHRTPGARLRVPISIDTQKPGVARAALAAGASVVNDIAANRTDPALWHRVAEAGAGYVCMHMQGTRGRCRTIRGTWTSCGTWAFFSRTGWRASTSAECPANR